MYQNIFALDQISFKDRKNTKEVPSEYTLNNYSYYEPKLEKDFYLKVFLKKALFDIDILELEDFLTFQNDNSINPERFIKTLKLKVLPSIKTIIKNAYSSLAGGMEYYKEIKLEDGFIETEGTIKNSEFEYYMFYHWTHIGKLTEEFEERHSITLNFIEKLSSTNTNSTPLNWCGKPSHLAFLVRSLIDEGYISPPTGKDKEINLTELSRQIISAFNLESKTTPNTLRVYLNSESEKHINLKKNFDNQGFNLPDSGLLG
ncbi:hypothetical protein GCM10022291_18300 [Postechiella marina]|uniref:Uncharacterized protein n=1 Tax=Postechiella marina TaxID=943941 RepID=A0ABP8C9A6_9FLAO